MVQKMSHDALISSLFKIGAIQFGEYTLKSGHTTSVYVNLRKIISYPNILRDVARAMWQEIADDQFDLICGVPYTALPIATCISLEQQIPMVMRRKEKKDYGTKQMIEGVYQPGQSCLIVEDVITKGESILETAQELKQVGLTIKKVVALVSREQGGHENLKNHHYQVKTILLLPDILQTLIQSGLLNEKEKKYADRYLTEKP